MSELEPVGVDEIYQALYDDIAAGVIGAGAFLREESLAARFGVSRTPVREALRRLESERILERWKRGRRVPQLSLAETMQVYELRSLLEGEAAAQAADSRSTSDLVELDRMTARDRQLGDSDLDRLSANFDFHVQLWSAARNPVLSDLLQSLLARLVGVPSSTFTEDRWRDALDEHEQIVEAIRERDAARARRLAADHVAGAGTVRMSIMQGLTPPPGSPRQTPTSASNRR